MTSFRPAQTSAQGAGKPGPGKQHRTGFDPGVIFTAAQLFFHGQMTIRKARSWSCGDMTARRKREGRGKKASSVGQAAARPLRDGHVPRMGGYKG